MVVPVDKYPNFVHLHDIKFYGSFIVYSLQLHNEEKSGPSSEMCLNDVHFKCIYSIYKYTMNCMRNILMIF